MIPLIDAVLNPDRYRVSVVAVRFPGAPPNQRRDRAEQVVGPDHLLVELADGWYAVRTAGWTTYQLARLDARAEQYGGEAIILLWSGK